MAFRLHAHACVWRDIENVTIWTHYEYDAARFYEYDAARFGHMSLFGSGAVFAKMKRADVAICAPICFSSDFFDSMFREPPHCFVSESNKKLSTSARADVLGS